MTAPKQSCFVSLFGFRNDGKQSAGRAVQDLAKLFDGIVTDGPGLVFDQTVIAPVAHARLHKKPVFCMVLFFQQF